VTLLDSRSISIIRDENHRSLNSSLRQCCRGLNLSRSDFIASRDISGEFCLFAGSRWQGGRFSESDSGRWVSVLKGWRLLHDVAELQRKAFRVDTANWSAEPDFHSDYARRASALNDFIDLFRRQHKLRLDRVYVAKMAYEIFAISARKIPTRLHTGSGRLRLARPGSPCLTPGYHKHVA
jgi:hypothetical protein